MYRRIGAADTGWHGRFFAFVARSFPGLAPGCWRLWADRGGWNPSYEVFALVEDGEIIGTVGRTRMALSVDGAPVAGFQLGAVATRAEQRGQGHGRALVEWVLAESDGPVLLFSNPRAVGFYARLGFREVARARAMARGAWAPAQAAPRCDPAEPGARTRLAALCARAVAPGGRLSARDYGGIALWHLTCGGQTLRWLPEFGAAVAARQAGGRLLIGDVLAPAPFDLRAAVPRLAEAPVAEVVLEFDPGLWWPGMAPVPAEPGETLFVRSLIEGPVMFPALAHT